jgi:nucleoside 2-deoxyribosyltransferase
MREHFTADWAFAIRGSLEKVVEANFPQELHSWPLLKTFNFEPYVWQESHIIFVFQDKLTGIPAGPSKPHILDDLNAPKQAPALSNLSEWQEYIQKKFSLRPQDAAIIIPLADSGRRVEDDWALWSESDKQLWHRQIESVVTRQFYYRKGIDIMADFYMPPGYQFLAEECARFFKDHPHYERNILIMTRFVPGNKLLEELDTELRTVLKSYGLEPVRADDKMYMRDRNIWNNVCIYLICCKYGIAILEDRVADEFNPNVALEYGFMRALNKPTLLLADVGFRNLRADIIGTLREHFDITDMKGTIKKPIEKWLKELGLLNG